jgi:hypothetical protein
MTFDTPALPRPPLTTRGEFREAIAKALVGAAVEGRRELIWVDANFADWPLDEPAVIDALTRWARRPTRKLLILASTFEDLPRRHPRFAQWRRTWAHRLECRSAPSISANDMPTLMLAGELYSLQLLDKHHWSGRWLDDDKAFEAWREVVDAIVQKSDHDFPANTLGL